MRSIRSRLTRSRGGAADHGSNPMKRYGTVSSFRNNPRGRNAKIEALAEQRRKQSNICLRCGQPLDLADARFESARFKDGVENIAIHKICPI